MAAVLLVFEESLKCDKSDPYAQVYGNGILKYVNRESLFFF